MILESFGFINCVTSLSKVDLFHYRIICFDTIVFCDFIINLGEGLLLLFA